MKLKTKPAIKTPNKRVYSCVGCIGVSSEKKCLETSKQADNQGLKPCRKVVYVEVVNVLCINTSCEYFKEECCPIDNTNCSIHCDSELLEGDCKRFEHE